MNSPIKRHIGKEHKKTTSNPGKLDIPYSDINMGYINTIESKMTMENIPPINGPHRPTGCRLISKITYSPSDKLRYG